MPDQCGLRQEGRKPARIWDTILCMSFARSSIYYCQPLFLNIYFWPEAGLVISHPTTSTLPPVCSPCLLPVIRLEFQNGDISLFFELIWPVTKSLLFAKWFYIRTIPFLADKPIPYSLRVSIALSLNAFGTGAIMISMLEWILSSYTFSLSHLCCCLLVDLSADHLSLQLRKPLKIWGTRHKRL